MQAVILAGGKGSRLKPFTNTIPKPLVPLEDKAILEVVLEQLRNAGVTEVILAVNHMAHLIRAFFGDGQRMGLNIRYSNEAEPLGTAAPLRLIDDLDDNFFVMNGDVLTTLDYSSFFHSHVENDHQATIAIFEKKVKIDLGVLHVENGRMMDYIEKPTKSYLVSTGIYVLNRSILKYLPPAGAFDLPDLMLKLRESDVPVHCHQGDFEWLDIGRASDYEAACRMFRNSRSDFLPE